MLQRSKVVVVMHYASVNGIHVSDQDFHYFGTKLVVILTFTSTCDMCDAMSSVKSHSVTFLGFMRAY